MDWLDGSTVLNNRVGLICRSIFMPLSLLKILRDVRD